ncbi:antitermination protein NusG [Serratia liquefaciens]|uniref:antitermination protein NusG n=1 Tax=Serratia liquefaciens TaxID=614 RepID=UPI0039C6E5B7
MALTERDIQIIKAVTEEVNEVMAEKNKALEECQQRISKLESEVEGLISLLGEQ